MMNDILGWTVPCKQEWVWSAENVQESQQELHLCWIWGAWKKHVQWYHSTTPSSPTSCCSAGWACSLPWLPAGHLCCQVCNAKCLQAILYPYRMPGVDLEDQTEGNSGQLVGWFKRKHHCAFFWTAALYCASKGFASMFLLVKSGFTNLTNQATTRCTTAWREVCRSVLVTNLASLILLTSLTTPRWDTHSYFTPLYIFLTLL